MLVEPGTHLGGLTSGGLGATDIGNKAAIGGIARNFYRRVARHYARDDAWTFQKRGDYKSPRQQGREDTMWTFEPHVAEEIYRRHAPRGRRARPVTARGSSSRRAWRSRGTGSSP